MNQLQTRLKRQGKAAPIASNVDGAVNAALAIADERLKAQGNPNGQIEISFSFCAEWDIASQTQRHYMEMCNAWTLDGAEPRALMANTTGARQKRKHR